MSRMPETTLEWVTALFVGVVSLIIGFLLPIFIYAWPLVLIVLIYVGIQEGIAGLSYQPFRRKPTPVERRQAKDEKMWLLPPLFGGLLVGAVAGFFRFGFPVMS